MKGLLLNPKLPSFIRLAVKDAWDRHSSEIEELAPGAIGVLTSGSTKAQSKEVSVVILSESAVLASANAVNEHLEASSQDIWGLMLPTFHVGGYMIPVRAKLTQSKVVSYGDHATSWDAKGAIDFLKKEKVTLLSMVPSQIFDVVQLGKNSGVRAPESLRAVVVGGGKLDPKLKEEGLLLGWPLLESYGMTEFGSQIATEIATENTPEARAGHQVWMPTLSHISVRTETTSPHRLMISGKSIFSSILYVNLESGESRLECPILQDGHWLTQDIVEIRTTHERGKHQTFLRFSGRASDVVKVLGENVDIARVREVMREVIGDRLYEMHASWEVLALPDSRKENRIVWVIENRDLRESPQKGVDSVLNESEQRDFDLAIRQRLSPVESPSEAWVVSEVPRSALGKIRFPELREILLKAEQSTAVTI